jgi:hypothetical protein
MDIHTSSTELIQVEVYKKISYGGFYSDRRRPHKWEGVLATSVMGRGASEPTGLEEFDNSIFIQSGQTQGLYVTLTSARSLNMIDYEEYDTGDIFTRSKDMNIYVGVSSKYPFGHNSLHKLWNGYLFYNIEN